MRSLAGSLLQIPRFAVYAGYMAVMAVIFVVTFVLSFPFYLFGHLKH